MKAARFRVTEYPTVYRNTLCEGKLVALRSEKLSVIKDS